MFEIFYKWDNRREYIDMIFWNREAYLGPGSSKHSANCEGNWFGQPARGWKGCSLHFLWIARSDCVFDVGECPVEGIWTLIIFWRQTNVGNIPNAGTSRSENSGTPQTPHSLRRRWSYTPPAPYSRVWQATPFEGRWTLKKSLLPFVLYELQLTLEDSLREPPVQKS